MCEFCSKHKRKKWFLDPENYSEKMLESRRRKNVLQKIGQGWEYYLRDAQGMISLSKMPGIGGLARPVLNELIRYEHSGQVVNLNDAKEIIDLGEKHVIFACACRKVIGAKEKMCCINFGPMRDLSVNPHEKKEEVDSSELKLRIDEWHKEGLFLQALYADAPYPIALCACERKYCFSCKMRFVFDFDKSLLKGHEAIIIDPLRCKGEDCGFECMKSCQFGAMFVDRLNSKVSVDPAKCFGCGLCAIACKKGALTLADRRSVPGASGKW
jgi:NAD-dependent dihydropyrimidine dehydrogenase PreA subunit